MTIERMKRLFPLRALAEKAFRLGLAASLLNPGPLLVSRLHAAEFEVTDRLTVDGSALFKSSSTWQAAAEPPVSPTDHGAIFFDTVSKRFRVSENGGAYTDLLGGAGFWSRAAGVLYPTAAGDGLAVGRADFPDFRLAVSTGSNAVLPALFVSSSTGRVGISTAAPQAMLHVEGDILASSMTINGPFMAAGTAGGVATTGAGTRLMWVPSLGALRAGRVSGTQWDAVGAGSAAFGEDNEASGLYATVPGGFGNQAYGDYAFAAGRRAKAGAKGSFVWADSQNADLIGTTTDQFLVRSQGGFQVDSSSVHFLNGGSSRLFIGSDGRVGIGTAVPVSTLTVAGDVRITGGSLYFPDGTSMSSAGVGAISSLSNPTDAIMQGDADLNGSGGVVLRTGMNDRLVISNAGLVGVATSNPQDALHVVGTLRVQGTGGALGVNLYNADSPADNSFAASPNQRFTGIYDSNTGGGVTRAEYSSEIGLTMTAAGAAPAGRLGFFVPTGSEKMSITSSGNVGIGMVSPVTQLDVGGAYGVSGSTVITAGRLLWGADGAVTAPSFAFFGEQGLGFYRPVSGAMGLASGGAERLRVDATGASVTGNVNVSGNYQIGGVNVLTASRLYQSADGVVGGPGFAFSNETNMGMYRVNAGVLGFATAGAQRGYFDASGFSVTGNINASGSIKIGGVTVLDSTRLYQAADGTAAGPAFGFSAEATGAGLFRPSAGVVAFSTLGSERGRFDSNGLGVSGSVVAGLDYRVGPNFSASSVIITSGRLLQAADGTASAPAYGFSSETNLGLFRPSAAALGFSAGGAQRMQVDSTALNVLAPLEFQLGGVQVIASSRHVRAFDGTVGAPGLSFQAESGMGLYRVGAGVLGLTTAGVERGRFDASGLTVAGGVVASGALTISGVQAITAGRTVQAGDGALATPSYTFSNETGTGFYRPAANVLAAVVGGTERGRFDASGLSVTGNVNTTGDFRVAGVPLFTSGRLFQAGDGTVGTPAYSFSSETGTGLARPAAGALTVSVGGTEIARANASGWNVTTGDLNMAGVSMLTAARLARSADGALSAPAYSFSAETNLGLYRPVGGALGFVTGATERGRFDSSGLTVTGNANVSGSIQVGGTPVVTPTRLVQSADGAAATPSFAFASEGNTGLYKVGAGSVGLAVLGVQRMQVDATALNVVSGELQIGGVPVITSGRYFRSLDGTAAAPGVSFASENNMGLYRIGAGVLGLTTAGVERGRFDASGLTVAGGVVASGALTISGVQAITAGRTVQAGDGALATPSYTFSNETGTGFYRPAANVVAAVVGGTERGRFDASGLSVTGNVNTTGDFRVAGVPLFTSGRLFQAGDGSVGTPAYSFSSETGTGLARPAAGALTVSVGGTEIARANASGWNVTTGDLNIAGTQTLTAARLARVADGALSAPAYSFGSETNLGLYRPVGGALGFVTGATERGRFDSSGLTVTGNANVSGSIQVGGTPVVTPTRLVQSADGAAATPSFAFASEGNTGLYKAAASAIGVVTAGVERVRFTTTAMNVMNGSIQVAGSNVVTSGRLVQAADGTAAAPSLAFSSEAGGLFRPAAGVLGLTTAGVERGRFDASGLTVVGGVVASGALTIAGVQAITAGRTVQAGDGALATPSYTFSSETGTGFYHPAANVLAAVVAGTERGRFDASGLSVTGNVNTTGDFRVAGVPLFTSSRLFQGGDGAAAGPAFSFSAETNTGMYRPVPAALSFATSGVERGRFDSSGFNVVAGDFYVGGSTVVTSSRLLRAQDGSSSAPAYAFHAENNSGVFRPVAGAMGFATGGTERGRFDSSGLTVTGNANVTSGNLQMGGTAIITSGRLVTAADGAVGAPAYSFGSDATMGLYRSGVNTLAVSIAGTQRAYFDTTGLNVTGNVNATGKIQIGGVDVLTATRLYQAADGAITGPGYAFASESNTGLYRPGAGVLGFTVTGTEYGRFTTSGLQVSAGNANVSSGDYRIGNTVVLTSARLVQPADGTTAAPAYSFNAQTNLGLYRPASQVLGFVTSGAERMRLDSSGYLGIGTTAPSTALTVAGTVRVEGAAGAIADNYVNTATPAENGTLSSPLARFTGVYDSNPAAGITRAEYNGDIQLFMTAAGASPAGRLAFSLAGSERFAVASSGNVGVGTSSPVQSLDVAGNYGVSGTQIVSSGRLFWGADGAAATPAYGFFTEQNTGLYRPGAGQLGFTTLGTQRGYFDANGLYVAGNVNVTGNFQVNGVTIMTGTRLYQADTGAVGTPAYSFNAETNTGLFRPAAGALAVSVLGSERARFDANGFNVAAGDLFVGGTQVVSAARNVRADVGSVGTAGFAFSGDTGTGLYRPSAGIVGVTASGVEIARLSSAGLTMTNGDIVIGGVSVLTSTRIFRSADGLVGVPAMGFANEANTGLYRPSNNVLGLTVAGTERGRFDGSGLSVTGNVSASGFISAGGVTAITAARLGQLADGAVAGPAYSFSSETNLGFYRAAAGTLAFGSGGSERMRLDASGRMGIGTASPTAMLTVAGAPGLRLEGAAAAVMHQSVNPNTPADNGTLDSPLQRFTGVYDSNPTATITRAEYNADMQVIMTAAGATPAGRLAFSVPNGSERMGLRSDGKLGIGTLTPAGLLDVNGNFAVSGSTVVTSTNTVWAAAGAANTPAYTFSAEPSLGMFRAAAGTLAFGSGNSERMRLDSAGNLGVGTSSPGSVLHGRVLDANTAVVTNALRLEHDTSGTAAANYGTGLIFAGESASGTENRDMGQMDAVWTDAADATRSAALRFSTVLSAGVPTERVRISSMGHVGVGTTAPNPEGFNGVALSVGPSATVNYPAYTDLQGNFTADGALGVLAFRNTAVAGTNTRVGQIEVRRDAANDAGTMVFYTRPNGGALTERVRILSTGNVGIGVAAPTAKLHIGGTAGVDGIRFPDGTLMTSAVAGTGGISNAVDTAIAADNDSNGSGVITFATRGAERIRVANDGSVGVGVTNPAITLHARAYDAGVGVTNILRLEHDTSGTPVAGMGASLLFASKSDTTANRDMAQIDALWTTVADATRASALRFSTLTGGGSLTEQMRITDTGKVGIGTNSPTYKLTVSGDISLANIGNRIYFGDGTWLDTATGGSASGISNALDAVLQGDSDANSTGDVVLKTGTSDRLHILNNGNVGVGTATPAAKLHMSSGTLLVDGDAAVPFRIGVSSMVLVSSGYLGLGTATPAQKLHLSSGTLLVDGDALVPFQIGVSSLVLNSAGFLGLGSAAPAHLLDVNGSMVVRGSATVAGIVAPPLSAAGSGVLYFDSGSGKFRASENGGAFTDLVGSGGWTDDGGQNRTYVSNAGRNVGIGTATPAAKLHLSSGTLLVDGNAATALRVGVSTFVVGLDGNVGVGTAAPVSTFTVAGNMRITGAGNALYFADGSSLSTAIGAGAASVTNAVDAVVQGDSDANASGGVILRTGASDRLTVTNGGNVGIGTSGPAEALHVVGGARFQRAGAGLGVQHLNPDSPVDGGFAHSPYERFTGVYDSNTGAGVTRAEYNADLQLTMSAAGAAPAGRLSFSVPSGNERLSIVSDGRVGVAMTAPTSQLDVGGSYGVSGSTVITASRLFWGADGAVGGPAYSFFSEQGLGLFRPVSGALGFASGGTERLRVDASGATVTGNVSVSGNIQIGGVTVLDATRLYRSADGAVGGTGFGFINEANMGMYRVSAGVLGFATAGTQRGYFDASGLSVTGNMNASGNIQIGGVTVLDATRLYRAADGAVGGPGFGFSADALGSGMFRPAAGALAFTTLGVERGRFDATGLSVTGNANLTGNVQIAGTTILTSARTVQTDVGSAAAPSYSFAAEPTIGMFRSGAGLIGFATASTERARIDSTGLNILTGDLMLNSVATLTAARLLRAADGAVGAPAISFSGENTTGLFRPGASALAISAGGTERGRFDATGLTVVGGVVASGAVTLSGVTSITAGRLAQLADGALATPAYAFSNEVNTGLFRPSASVLAFSVAGTERGRFDAGGFDVTGNLDLTGNLTMSGVNLFTSARLMQAADGAAAGPAYAFSLETNTGMFRPAASVLAFASGGTERMRLDANGLNVVTGDFYVAGSTVVTASRLLRAQDGAPGTPAYAFHSENNTGVFRPVAGALAVATGGSERGRFDSSGLSVTGNVNATGKIQIGGVDVLTASRLYQANDGSAAGPSFSFANSTDMGLYRESANILGVATNGVQRLRLNSSALTLLGATDLQVANSVVITSTRSLQSADGSAAAPTHTFIAETNTGLFRPGAGVLAMTTSGVERGRFDTTGLTVAGGVVASGALTIAGTQVISSGRLVQTADGAVGGPAYSFSNDATMGIYRPAAGQLGFATAGVQRGYFDANGLYVVGNVNLTGTVQMGGTNLFTAGRLVQAADGAAAGPAFAFSAETNTGMFRPAAGVLAFASGGTERGRFDGNGLNVVAGDFYVAGSTVVTATRLVRAQDGAAGTPAYAFHSENNTGVFRPVAGALALATGGSERGRFDSSGLSVTGNVNATGKIQIGGVDVLTASRLYQAADGAAAGPSFSFAADATLGLFREAGGTLGVATGGVQRLRLNSSALVLLGSTDLQVANSVVITSTRSMQAADGTVAAPTYTFISETNTGLFRPGAGVVAVTGNGAERGRFDGTGLTVVGGVVASGALTIAGTQVVSSGRLVQTADGAVGTPAYTFSSEPNTGVYRAAAGQIGFVTGGTQRGYIDASGLYVAGNVNLTGNLQISGTNLFTSGRLVQTGDGAAAGPAFSFSAETNTGMFRPAAGVLAFSSAGAERVRLDASGLNVVAGDFYVAGSTIITAGRLLRSPDGALATPAYSFHAENNAGMFRPSAGVLAFVTAGVERGRFDTSGLSVTGNVNASGKIQIGGVDVLTASRLYQAADGAAAGPGFSFANDATMGMYRAGAGILSFATAGTQRGYFDANGLYVTGVVNTPSSFQIGGTDVITSARLVRSADGALATPGLAFASEVNTGLYRPVANVIGFTVAGTEYGRFNTSGLQVSAGNVNVSAGDYRIGNTPVLTSARLVQAADGTAAAPSLGFSSQANMGLFRVGSGILGFTTAGTERMRLDSSGYLGIGTTNPTTALTVAGTSRVEAAAGGLAQNYVNTATPTNDSWQDSPIQRFTGVYDSNTTATIVRSEYNADLQLIMTAAGASPAGRLAFSVPNGTERLSIRSDGRVGIGTTSPGTLLDVAGTYGVSGTTVVTAGRLFWGADGAVGTPAYTFANEQNLGIYRAGAGQLAFTTLGVQRGYFDANGLYVAGNINATGAIQVNGVTVMTGSRLYQSDLGAAATPAYSFNAETNTGMFRAAAGALAFSVLGTERARFDASGFNVVSGDFYVAGSTVVTASRQIRPADGTVASPGFNFFSEGALGLYRPAAGVLGFAAGGVELGRISSAGLNIGSGDLLVGGTSVVSSGRLLRGADGTVAAPALTFSAETNTGLYRPAGNVLGFTVAGTERGRFDSSGLGVTGSVNVTGSFQIGGATVLTASRLYQGADGAAAAPAFSFSSETGTGLYRIGAGLLGFSVTGTERMRLDSTGRLGIGSTSPSTLLTIAGTTGLRLEGSANTVMLNDLNPNTPADNATQNSPINRFTGVYDSAPGVGPITRAELTADEQLVVSAAGAVGAGRLAFAVPSGTERFSILSNGLVGVGYTTPALTLDVGGNYGVSGSTVITSTRTFWAADGAAATPGYTFAAEPSLGLFRPLAATLGFASGNVERMRLDSAGNLGVGTSSPGSLLHGRIADAGTATVTNVLRLEHDTTGTAAANFGTGLLFAGESGNATENRDMGQVDAVWTDPVDATRSSALRFLTVLSGGVPVERVRISSMGHVGVGTTAPNPEGLNGIALTVGPHAVANYPTYLDLQGNLTSNGTIGAVDFRNTAVAGVNTRVGQIEVQRLANNDAGAMLFHTRPTGGSLTERMRILPTGELGVGVSTPTVPLAVIGSPGTTHESNRSNSHAQVYGRGFAFAADGAVFQAGVTSGLSLAVSRADPLAVLSNEGAGDLLRLHNGATERLRFTAGGSLGIGAVPARRLHVADTAAGAAQPTLTLENTAPATAATGPELDWRATGVDQASILSGWNGAATTDAYLALYTRGSNLLAERMRITSVGYVGVGVTNPGVPLAVVGTPGTTHESLRVDGQAQVYGRGFAFAMDAAAHQGGVTGGLSIAVNRADPSAVFSNAGAGDLLRLYNGATERVRVLASGNIGVGTTTPNYAGESSASRVLTLTGVGSATDDYGALELRNPTATAGFSAGKINYVIGGTRVAAVGATTVGAADAGELVFNTRPASGALTERVRIDRTGNVGVGISAPAAKLHVVGGDVAVGTQGNGVILKATDGANCFRLTVNNAGTLSTSSVTCP